MTGSFNSAQQAEEDTNYFAISLHMYPIWEKEANDTSFWLYVEQTVSAIPTKPYRQRVYRVTKKEGGFKSEIFSLSQPKDFVQAWKEPESFRELSPDSITLLPGCAVYLRYEPKKRIYRGSTHEQDCKNTFRGAAYATSEVTVTEREMRSWDRGYNAQNEHIWGAEYGPYIFRKQP